MAKRLRTIGIKNKYDELCASDLQSGRLRKVSTVGVADCMKVEIPMVNISFSRFGADDLPETELVKVRYANIDFAGHTNNKEYVRFMLNTHSVRDMATRPIREMEVVYINQSYENDILTVRKGSFQNKDII